MEKHDLTPINDELKKAITGAENNLETEVNNLIKRFADYQDEVIKMANLSALTYAQITKLDETLKQFTKAFELIKQILNSGGSSEEKITMLKAVIE